MPYCINCGSKISDEAKFCPQCGHKTLQVNKQGVSTLPEESIPVPDTKPYVHKVDRTFTLLDPGDVFYEHYRIEKIIGRDDDGITYLATDNRYGELRSLKLFHQAYFDNVDKLFGSIERMSKIKQVLHPNVAKAFEVNQTHRPAYIVSDFIEGKSLASVKEHSTALLSEALCRNLAVQIVDAAIAIRKTGLSVRNLNLNNIVLTQEQNIVILSSGINYDVGDERDDIFNIGLLLAKLFSTSTIYETLYTKMRLADKKFDYISGVTNQLNAILARCLHRNPTHRYPTFASMAIALKSVKPIAAEDLYVSGESDVPILSDENKMPMPARKLDINFWLIIFFTIAFIFVLMSTNLLDTIFGQDKTSFKFTGFLAEVPDTTLEQTSVPNDGYRGIKSTQTNVKFRTTENPTGRIPARNTVNPSIEVPASNPLQTRTPYNQGTNTSQGTTPATQTPAVPSGFAYIKASTFAYGSLKSDALSNASLSSFFIDKTEVTQAEWEQYMAPVSVSLVGDFLPVDNITWYEAIQYCNKRSEAEGLMPAYKISGLNVSCNFKANGYRLPTEAEWEYAARATKLFKYSGSNVANQISWYKANSQGRIRNVQTKSANAFGLHDMTGNVNEWCWDWYDSNYPKTMPYVNPTGPTFGTVKAIRGGSVENGDNNGLELLTRTRGTPSKAYPHVGFRLVRTK